LSARVPRAVEGADVPLWARVLALENRARSRLQASRSTPAMPRIERRGLEKCSSVSSLPSGLSSPSSPSRGDLALPWDEDPSAERRTSAGLEKRIKGCREANLERKRKVQWPLLALAMLFYLGYIICIPLNITGVAEEEGRFIAFGLFWVGSSIHVASILPSEHMRIRRATVVVGMAFVTYICLALFRFARESLLAIKEAPGHAKYLVAKAILQTNIALAQAWALIVLITRTRGALPRRQLEVLGEDVPRAVRWCALFMAGVVACEVLLKTSALTIYAEVQLIVIWFSLGSLPQEWRVRLQAWLASRGGGVPAAAGISALLGSGCSPEAVVAMAEKNFYAVPLDQVFEEDLKDSAPDPRLAKRVLWVSLGEVDAFISHSWHDDAADKWMALQQWRLDFVSVQRREPLVWIDKFCIDQDNIEEFLPALPVCLAGCRTLLVLAGSTYISRIWCIVELFVFVHMGGTPDRIEVRQVSHLEWEKFDVRRTTAYKDSDIDRLMNVIEAGAGSITDFNASIQNLMAPIVGRTSTSGTPRHRVVYRSCFSFRVREVVRSSIAESIGSSRVDEDTWDPLASQDSKYTRGSLVSEGAVEVTQRPHLIVWDTV